VIPTKEKLEKANISLIADEVLKKVIPTKEKLEKANISLIADVDGISERGKFTSLAKI
jgi:hypothetical protein